MYQKILQEVISLSKLEESISTNSVNVNYLRILTRIN